MSRVLMWIRGPLIFGGALLLMLLMGQFLHLATGWPLWTVALIAALAAEIILRLYQYEQGAIGRTKVNGSPGFASSLSWRWCGCFSSLFSAGRSTGNWSRRWSWCSMSRLP